MFVDTHAHLDFPDFSNDLDDVIERARAQSVTHIITVGTDLASSSYCITIANAYEHVYATVGIHPHEAKDLSLSACRQEIETLVADKKVVALGEIGLDYFRNLSPKEDQLKLVRMFFELYKLHDLPFILHCREAHDDLFELMRSSFPKKEVHGVMHCFSGNEQDLHTALDFGLYVSFPGPVTYKKNDTLRHITTLVPDERLLIETDSPYLTPQSRRGKRNEPSFMIETADMIADVRGITREDLGRITTRNCNRLFRIPDLDTSAHIVYKIRDSLYVNTTSNCTNECTFCARYFTDEVKGYTLRLEEDPSAEAVLKEIDSYREEYKEVVFCGFGEPMLRLDFIKKVAAELKKKNTYIRVDTNGHGNLIHKRNILPELARFVDEMCISLNTPDERLYNELCKPLLSGNVYDSVKEFISECKKYIPKVVITFLDLPQIDIGSMKQIAQTLGVECRMRHYNKVG